MIRGMVNKIAKITSVVLAILAIIIIIIDPIIFLIFLIHPIVFISSVLLFIIALSVTLATEKRRWLQGIISALIGAIIGGFTGIGGAGMITVMHGIAGAIVGSLLFVEINWIRKLVQGKSRTVRRLTIFFTVIVGLIINIFLVVILILLLFRVCGGW